MIIDKNINTRANVTTLINCKDRFSCSTCKIPVSAMKK